MHKPIIKQLVNPKNERCKYVIMASLLKYAKLEISGKEDKNCIMTFTNHENSANPKNHFTQLFIKILYSSDFTNNIFNKINPAHCCKAAPANPTIRTYGEKPKPNAERANVIIIPYINNFNIALPFFISTKIPACSNNLISKEKTASVNQPLY